MLKFGINILNKLVKYKYSKFLNFNKNIKKINQII